MTEKTLGIASNILKTLGFALFLLFLTGAGEKQDRLSKKEAIAFLKSFSESNQSKLKEIDQQIRASLMKTYNSDLAPDQKSLAKTLNNRELEVLTLKRKEHQLRENFIDRLIFSIDRKYSNGPWQGFLAQQVIEMASIEATSMGADVGFVKFCGYLSAALKRIPERSENLFAFIEGYIEFSTLLNPRAPSEYLRQRSYTNGRTAEFSQGVPKEVVGDIVEDRLARLAYLKSLERKSFEQRAPILKPLDVQLQKPILQPPTAMSELPQLSQPKLGNSAPPSATKEASAADKTNPTLQTTPSTEAQLKATAIQPNTDATGMKMRIKLNDIHRNSPSQSQQPERVEMNKQTYDEAL
ncbi:MAG: hypothetical protein HRT45_10475 [Bdellovibrionales bacterium]|nr:hypothetical protein [Bdellovibrionales bacterium]